MTLREDGFRRARAFTGTLITASLAGAGIGASALFVASAQTQAAPDTATAINAPGEANGPEIPAVPSKQTASNDGDDFGDDGEGDGEHDDGEGDGEHDDDSSDYSSQSTDAFSNGGTSTTWNLGGSSTPVKPSAPVAPHAKTSGS